MKKVLLLGVALLLIASVTSAQLPPQGYIGLYADGDHVNGCAVGVVFVPFYCFVLPPEGGMDSVEFSTTLGTGVAGVMNLVVNPDIILTMGSVPGDYVATFGSCQGAWTEVFHADAYVPSDVEPSFIYMGAHSLNDYPLILTCDIIETEALISTDLHVNDADCTDPVAAKESTWGAIKNMYE
ncbi:MAG: hypothetical protein KAX13_07635 [Candidatus Krumholzibacteria bacterium]|nr:hypothetical protein [Candidatus Krumholzibacteria bacterium]